MNIVYIGFYKIPDTVPYDFSNERNMDEIGLPLGDRTIG